MLTGLYMITTYIESVEQIISGLLAVHEELEVLKHTLLDSHAVVVPDRILSQEVELYDVFLPVQFLIRLDVLHAQRTTTHRVSCLSFLLLVTSSQRKL